MTESKQPPSLVLAVVAAGLFLLLPFAASTYGVSALWLFSLAALHHAAAVLGGGALLTRLAPSLASRGERWLLGWAFGLALIGFAMFFLGLAGVLGRGAVVVVPALALVGGLLERERLSSVVGDVAAVIDRRALGATAVVVGAVVCLCALPPTFYDALSYHVSLPQQFLLWGRVITTHHHLNTSFPLVGELSLAPLLFLTGDPRAMNVGQGGVVVLVVLLTSALGRRVLGTGAGGMAALVVAAMPLVTFLAMGTKPDLLHAAFALGMLSAFLPPVLDDDAPLHVRDKALLLGLMAGAFIATKSSGLPLAASLFVVVALVPSWRRELTWQGLAIAAAACAVLALPLYAKNLIVLGNPIFPHGASLFPTPAWAAQTRAIIAHDIIKEDTLEELLALWRLPWDLSFVVRDGTMNNLPGPLPLLGALLLVVVRPLPPALRRAWALVLVTLPVWLSLFSLLRYNPFVWLVAALSAGFAFEALWRRGGLLRGAVAAMLALGVVSSAAWTLSAQEVLLRRPSKVYAGGASEQQFLTEAYEPFAAYRFINESLPQDAVIFPVSDPRLAYLERRSLPSDVYTEPLIEGIVKDNASLIDVRAAVRAQGATHLLYEPRAIGRLKTRGFLRWSAQEQQRFDDFVASLGAPLYGDERGFFVYRL